MLLGCSRFFFPLKKNQPLSEGSPDSSGVALPPTGSRFSLRVYPSILLVRTLNPLQARAGIRRRNGRISKLGKKEREEKEEEEENKGVRCEVEVVSWRERRIKAAIKVEADEQAVWKVLTDYERLADFIPNLVCSERIPCPHPGRIWVMQKGLQRALYWHIEARVVLDLQELPSAEAGKELHFRMVDGDFMKFEGKWSLKAGVRSSTTILSYELNVIPRFNYPAIFIERIIRSDLPVNLQAIASQAEKVCRVSNREVIDETILDKNFKAPILSHHIHGLPSSENSESSSDSRRNHNKCSVGSLLSPPSEQSNSSWSVYGKVCRLDRICMADEVHFRRCDDLLENGGVHRSVAASITVKAPVHRVWSVLTDYESLPEFVPNLAIGKILSREKNKVRILQEGCKGLLYMVLHARVVLDLHEQFEQEITFQQVEGDFDSFQGKWILEQLGNQHTLLKYVVESKMQKNSLLSEAIVEEVIYEDLPSNLCAIRDRIEECEPSLLNSRIDGHDKFSKSQVYPDGRTFQVKVTNDVQIFRNDRQNERNQRTKVPGLQRDIEILKSELRKYIEEHGQEGLMPMRKQLRLDGRVDLEKAITRMGGFRHIASLMNLSLAYKHRKPKGYWDSLDNLHEEIVRFQRSWGMDPSFMPSKKSFERAGRYDLSRALEKWGGLQEVSRLLSLKLRHPRGVTASQQKRNDSMVDQASYSPGRKCKAFVSQDTQKWLTTLQHLDINWVE